MIALSLFEGALNLSWHSVRETVRKEPLVLVDAFFLGFLLSFLMDKLLDTD